MIKGSHVFGVSFLASSRSVYGTPVDHSRNSTGSTPKYRSHVPYGTFLRESPAKNCSKVRPSGYPSLFCRRKNSVTSIINRHQHYLLRLVCCSRQREFKTDLNTTAEKKVSFVYNIININDEFDWIASWNGKLDL